MTILKLLTAGGFALMIMALVAITHNLNKASEELRRSLEAFNKIQKSLADGSILKAMISDDTSGTVYAVPSIAALYANLDTESKARLVELLKMELGQPDGEKLKSDVRTYRT